MVFCMMIENLMYKLIIEASLNYYLLSFFYWEIVFDPHGLEELCQRLRMVVTNKHISAGIASEPGYEASLFDIPLTALRVSSSNGGLLYCIVYTDHLSQ